MKENYQIYLPYQFHWRAHLVDWDAQLSHKKMKTMFLSNMSKSRRLTSTFFPTNKDVVLLLWQEHDWYHLGRRCSFMHVVQDLWVKMGMNREWIFVHFHPLKSLSKCCLKKHFHFLHFSLSTSFCLKSLWITEDLSLCRWLDIWMRLYSNSIFCGWWFYSTLPFFLSLYVYI